MLYYVVKVAVSAILIVIISEISKRSSLIGAILASVPLVSVLAMIWIFVETKEVQTIAELSKQIFFLVIPSLLLFILLPLMLNRGVSFPISLGVSIGATSIGYFIMIAVMRALGFYIL